MHCSDNSIVSSGRTKDKEFLIFWSENVGVIDKFCGNGTLLCIDVCCYATKRFVYRSRKLGDADEIIFSNDCVETIVVSSLIQTEFNTTVGDRPLENLATNPGNIRKQNYSHFCIRAKAYIT